MSPNVGNFVHDLVEMAKAMETLPQVQQAFDLAVKRNDELAQTVQERELAIIGYKEQIEGLHSRVRSLEVERDDASFRVLEAEDLTSSVLNSARVAQAGLEAMITMLDPPKPQPEPVKEPEHVAVHKWDEPKDQSEANPTANTMENQSQSATSAVENASTQSTLEGNAEAPKSDANPIVKAEGTSSETASSHSASSTVADTNAGKGPYFGKSYGDYPAYLSLREWLAGGGTEADYYSGPIHKANF